MNSAIPEVAPLSAEEREYLAGQGELIMAKLAAMDGVLAMIGTAMAEAEAEYSKAKIEAERCRAALARLGGLRKIAVERTRNLKTLATAMPMM